MLAARVIVVVQITNEKNARGDERGAHTQPVRFDPVPFDADITGRQ
jgi:hypothetical protein